MGKIATIVVLLGVFSFRICFAASAFLSRSDVDELSLMSMKANLNSDILARNWSKETSFCTWIGIVCGRKHPQRVIAINLANIGLVGTIGKDIGNLSFLRFLDISNNSINGIIPSEMGLLRRLKGFNLSNNYLSGSIPTSLSACVELKMLDLSHNNLSGTLPVGFGNWSQLQELSLRSNYLEGKVPLSIGNLSNLKVFDISENRFSGTIILEIGQLSSLKVLNLQANNLNGQVPQAIFNLSMLQFLSLRENNLSGSLPFSIDIGLPNIQQIFLGNVERRFNLRVNQFYGKIPDSISNLSKLITLDLSDNSFTHVPLNLGSLPQLQMLNLEANQFMNNLSNPEQDFLSSLAACKNLNSIQISFNPITGVLPKSLGSSNLSASLETLKAFSCKILSPLPDEIGNLSKLLWLNLGYNHFDGAIPSTLGQLRSLQNLEIYGNRFHGSISPVLCNLNHLHSLNLALNSLSGEVPSCLGNLPSLREIHMSRNEFNSDIKSMLWFHKGATNVKNLVELDLSWNQLSGVLPSTVSQLENLVRLSLSRNRLKGPIVESFTDMKDLQHLDLSHNNLSGRIPKSLEALSHLDYFDVSFNELRGKIPDRGCFVNFTDEFFVGNEGLCGAPRFKVKKCRSLSKKKQLSYFSILIVVVIGLTVILIRRICVRKPPSLSIDPLFLSIDYIKTLSEMIYDTILEEEKLIAKRDISSVYVGRFPDGSVKAVKLFNLDMEDALNIFNKECQISSRVRHRNLVKIFTCCKIDVKAAFVMPYMPNSDLEKWLYSTNCSLNLFERLRIMKDVACVVEHLHHYHLPTIVHCDLNPKNILLDEDMVAHVCDFGIAKILYEGEIMVDSGVLGTIGYIAPEYGSQGMISTAVDVYSYGILLLETLSRRKPTDPMFPGELIMRKWVSESIPAFVSDIVENELRYMHTDEESRVTLESWLKSVVVLAQHCTAGSPRDRPNMKDVFSRITSINSNFNNLLNSFLA